MKAFILCLTLFSISCLHSKQTIKTGLKFTEYKALYFEINATNTTDTILKIAPPSFECPDFWIENKIWVIEKTKNDTLKLNYADCDSTIDPETYEIENRRVEVKPHEDFTYIINLSSLIYSPTLPVGHYQVVLKLHDWDFTDTTFVENFIVKQKLSLRKIFFDNLRAYSTLEYLEDLSEMNMPDSISGVTYLEYIVEKLQREDFFKQRKRNSFKTSRLRIRFEKFSQMLLDNAQKKILDTATFEEIKREAAFFYRKLKKKYLKEIPNFKNTLKHHGEIDWMAETYEY